MDKAQQELNEIEDMENKKKQQFAKRHHGITEINQQKRKAQIAKSDSIAIVSAV